MLKAKMRREKKKMMGGDDLKQNAETLPFPFP